MAAIESALIYHLLADPRIAALAGERINLAGNVPQGQTVPYLVVRKLAGERTRSLAGFSGLVRSRIQVECCDRTAGGAIRLREAVKQLFRDGFAGQLGDPRDPVVVQWLVYDDDFQTEERVGSGKANDEILQTIDLIVWFEKGRV